MRKYYDVPHHYSRVGNGNRRCSAQSRDDGACHLLEGHGGEHQIPPPNYYKYNPYRCRIRGLPEEEYDGQ